LLLLLLLLLSMMVWEGGKSDWKNWWFGLHVGGWIKMGERDTR